MESLGWTSFVFPIPSSVVVAALSAVSLVSLANAGFSEIKGRHLKYSKFFKPNNTPKLSSRNGMLFLYTPAFLAGVSSFGLFPDQDFRFFLLKSALTIHFFKRLMEVLFIHKYSGGMDVESAIPISLSYFLSTATMIYAQHLVREYPDPPIDLKYIGIVLFFIGISGNFYHHYLLSKLRSSGDDDSGKKEYKIPKGGLFGRVICPHYLFEIIGFWGVSFISQTLYSFCFTIGTTLYLMGRSYATRRWYLSKFDHFPNHVKALIPFLF